MRDKNTDDHGYVYALTNEAMPGLIKIGRTGGWSPISLAAMAIIVSSDNPAEPN